MVKKTSLFLFTFGVLLKQVPTKLLLNLPIAPCFLTWYVFNMKFIFISGGVVSGLGKGVTAASVGLILKSKGLRVTNVKIDMYLNVDAGTIRTQEHGEVFVCDDGIETDQDLGNY